MTKGRFAKVRPTSPEPVTESAPAPIALDPVEVPPTMRQREGRTPLGVRVRPSLQANLNEVVTTYKARGWDVSQHMLLEHFLTKLGDPAFAQAFMLELAGRGDVD